MVVDDAVADEVFVDEVVTTMVQLDVVVADPVQFFTTDTMVTTPSTEPSMHIDGGFPGPINRSVLTEYTDHVALRVWQGEVYVFYV